MNESQREVVELAATTGVRTATEMSSAVLDDRLARIERRLAELAAAVTALAAAECR